MAPKTCAESDESFNSIYTGEGKKRTHLMHHLGA